MDSTLMGVLVVAGAAALALVLRAASRGDEQVDRGALATGTPEPEAASAAAPAGAPEEEWDEAASEVAVMASSGWMLLPFEGGVRLWAPVDEAVDPGHAPRPGEVPAEGVAAERGRVPMRPAAELSAGDLIAARVVRGAPGEEPWRVEALGRDREFSEWGFDSEEAARAACALLERLVVKVPPGPDGEPRPVSDEEIAEARRIVEETLRELDAGAGTEPPGDAK